MTFITLILLLSLVLIIGALIYFANKNTRKQKKILSDEIQKVAVKGNFTWEIIDVSRHRSMAWNSRNRVFLYGRLVNEVPLIHLVRMDDVQQVELVETFIWEMENGQRSNHKNLTEFTLQITFKEKTSDPLSLIFFSENLDGLLEKNNQIQKAKEWLSRIQTRESTKNAQKN